MVGDDPHVRPRIQFSIDPDDLLQDAGIDRSLAGSAHQAVVTCDTAAVV
jgi:hypothetical protein